MPPKHHARVGDAVGLSVTKRSIQRYLSDSPFSSETAVTGGVVGGIAGGSVGGLAAAPSSAAPIARDAIAAAQLAQMEPAAQGRELGDLFEYRIGQPISIAKNQSALPFPTAGADKSGLKRVRQELQELLVMLSGKVKGPTPKAATSRQS